MKEAGADAAEGESNNSGGEKNGRKPERSGVRPYEWGLGRGKRAEGRPNSGWRTCVKILICGDSTIGPISF